MLNTIIVIANGLVDSTGQCIIKVPKMAGEINCKHPIMAAAEPAVCGKGSIAPPAPAPIIKAPPIPANIQGKIY